MKNVTTALLAAASVSMVPASAHASLVGYWNMDEAGGDIADSSGNGLTGSSSGSGLTYSQGSVTAGTYGSINISSLAAAAFGDAINFDGSTGSFALGQPAELDALVGTGTGAYTAMAWVDTNNLPSSTRWRIFSTGGPNGVGFGVANVDRLIHTTYGVHDRISTGTVPSLNTGWHHVAVTFDGTSITFYGDGNAIGTATSSSIDEPGANNFRIGASAAVTEHFNGLMDDLKIYDSVLTQSEIISAALPQSSGLILNVEGTSANNSHMVLSSGGATYNTLPAPPSNQANIYWDADKNGVFGETGIGENTGNSEGDLGFMTSIQDGDVLNFGVEGFGTAGASGSLTFTITKSDFSEERLTVTEGAPVSFFDSNGDEWIVSFDFNQNGYGDVVQNVSSAPGNSASDHQGVLSFTLVPEPSSLALLGLGGLLITRRRRA